MGAPASYEPPPLPGGATGTQSNTGGWWNQNGVLDPYGDPNRPGPVFGPGSGVPVGTNNNPLVGVSRPLQARPRFAWEADPQGEGSLAWSALHALAGDRAPGVGEPPELERRAVDREAVFGFRQEPVQDVLRSLFNMEKPALRALQRQMFDAGYYGNARWSDIVRGSVDDATYNAFGQVLNQTVQYNDAGQALTWHDVLAQTLKLRKDQGTNGGPKRAPFVARTTNADDIERVSQQVAASLVGENVDPGLVKRIISQYQAAEVSSQRQAYDAAETGGTVTDAPALDTFAAQAIEKADPTRTTAYRAADSVLGAFEQIVAGPFG